jgi:membrane-associated phospholipid phosphatase
LLPPRSRAEAQELPLTPGPPAGGAATQAPKKESRFRLRAELDVPLLLVTGTGWALPEILDRQDEGLGPCHDCDSEEVNALDRTVIGFRYEGADTASDVLVTAIPVAAALLSLADIPEYGGKAYFEDMVLIVEAMTLTGTVHQAVRHIVKRPRPYMYRDDHGGQGAGDPDDRYSFFSGHTSMAFAAASSFACIFSIRHPRSKLRPVVWVLSMSLAGTVGVLRALAGKHFWSDVGVGALVGTGLGVLTPAWHRRRGAGGKSRLAARLIASPGGVGVAGRF